MSKDIIKYFSLNIRQALMSIPQRSFEQIQEIRLRAMRPIALTINGNQKFLAKSGGFSDSPILAMICDASDIEHTLKFVCDHSVYSFQRELSQCFVTVCGGHRVGISGSAAYNDSGRTLMPTSISSLNFRIAHERIGMGSEIFDTVLRGKCEGLLIVGPPMSAKTTVLRDLTRLLGNFLRVSLIDERSEIASVHAGVPNCNVGHMTDVFDGYTKPSGILCAVRAMSPQVIICDEIGSDADAKALLDASKSGVKVVASIHAGTIADALSKDSMRKLIDAKVFKYAILLGHGENIGRIKDIERLDDENYRNIDDTFVECSLRSFCSKASCGKHSKTLCN